jgi:hypothetical protein
MNWRGTRTRGLRAGLTHEDEVVSLRGGDRELHAALFKLREFNALVAGYGKLQLRALYLQYAIEEEMASREERLKHNWRDEDSE